ncbi:McrB family protein [Nitrosomonas europaea]|uniref:AAA ATPase superfamily n=1 Tax=Nitrosomonas europaea (strain ATCC 19718 / CIP 103999 / KCTC 2705 / NBRC 14298) TaxID=228410 RepID=Q82S33_NITEU|nr:AAA family ATPase [Nitrosomonas europaea]CAD86440.1 AAA ATPase superfamily [Nitrosomonas europaea ATCC 19718]SDW86009.1 5-methylcytosine-specific restriction enzyme B [Nitrosomonas europaea]SET39623.1 5-methylcytosine-specific restriction enzyme B [Nitrosomonas europaea]SJZ95537.1 5-methylcytosine-specific restriction enzyme B [Nitrosomonas europaea]
MTTQTIDSAPHATWFVGASYGGTDDQMPRFLAEGIWENGYDDKLLEVVRSMRPGERIAIKSSYTRKHGLPFDSRGRAVSVMGIKAVGTITENLNDGKRVKVDWAKVEPVREWYFYTHRATIWRVLPGEWMNDALIAFAFDGKPQDVDRFRNEPFWRERYGTTSPEKQRFEWTDFYEAVAEKLLAHADDRTPLIEGIHEIASRVPGLTYLQDKFPDGTSGPLRDICPFTTMGTFNRSMTDANRKTLAGELAKLLGVTVPVPPSFEGIPVLNNQRSWFFAYADKRGAGDIDALWKVFVAASKMVDGDQLDTRDAFIRAYDEATQVWGVAWNLSTGLYWAHPWEFLTLDSQSRHYINKRLGLNVAISGQQGPCDGRAYLKLLDDLRSRFGEDGYPVHSFPDLSLASWMYKDPVDEPVPAGDIGTNAGAEQETEGEVREAFQVAAPIVPYSVEDILKDGCFLERAEIDRLLDRLRTKKNLILQGPPGTGKTWLAKRLAFALMGQKDDSKVRAVQFHPNLSYEDFVRGWRPTGEGKLSLADGVFMEAIKAASKDPSSKFVVVIEEINRGNPAQIFGELLTLLEAGKRTPNEALELCYPDADGKRRPVHIPENLYVVGTMNIADRSLALVDLALRRRFAFVGLEPRLGQVWRDWVVKECAVDPGLVADIERRIAELNDQIAADARLGKQFRIGHSYVTPAHRLEAGDTKKWFLQVVETEIGPLLDEYWFDAPDEAQKAIARLTQGW